LTSLSRKLKGHALKFNRGLVPAASEEPIAF